MLKFALMVLTFLSIVSAYIHPQSVLDSNSINDAETQSRLKLSLGYFGGEYIDLGENTIFLNFNYRASQLLTYNDPPQFGFAFEAGINTFGGLFPLYAKAGPELEVIKNFILAANFGYNGILRSPFPFYGINIFYLIDIAKNLNTEIEVGFHSAFGIETDPLFYINFGLSID
jgi:hypothetical protein